MPASTKPGANESSSSDPAPADTIPADLMPAAKASTRRVFRRRSTVTTALVLSGILVVVGAILTPDEIGHGFFPGISGLTGVLPLVVLALIVGAWPHVIVFDDHMEVHNTFIWYSMPYAAIGEIKQIRMGLILRTHAGKTIPMTAYTSGSAARMFHHQDAANLVINAVQDKMEFLKSGPEDQSPRGVRHLEIRNVVAVVVTVALAIAVVYAAAHTYH